MSSRIPVSVQHATMSLDVIVTLALAFVASIFM